MKTYRQLFGLAIALCLVLVSLPITVNAQDGDWVGVVSAGTVNIHATPALDGKNIGFAKKGDSFKITGKARGSNRIWYRVVMPNGGEGWISERVLNITPDPELVPWIGDNNEEEEIPLVMDCGTRQPILYVGTFGVVTKNAGLNITKEPGLGKTAIDRVKYNELFKVVDGPFCTKLSAFAYHIEWLVETGKGVQGYLLEGVPQGRVDYIHYTEPSKTNSGNVKTDRPVKISDEDIEAVSTIFKDIQSGALAKPEAEGALMTFVKANDKDTLAWIVRRIPVYNHTSGKWESFARYTNLSAMKFKANSQLDLDPVGTTIDIIYGEYETVDQVWEAMGCGG
jgi:hypothetical protein